jgi:type II secretory ATPase GspE/PulE/Tfp pilus assembly ATPase PilB-like protein
MSSRFRTQDNLVEVAMVNPLDLEAQAYLAALSWPGNRSDSTPHPTRSKPSLPNIIKPILMVSGLVERLGVDDKCEYVGADIDEAPPADEPDVRAPVIKLVNSLLTKAILTRASDVHIEQAERGTEIRFRIDGTLRNVMTLPRNIGAGPGLSHQE